MANTYKDIIITPSRSSDTYNPNVEFRGANSSANATITLTILPDSNGTLSFDGANTGQLFSISNDMDGVIFSVNDKSGIPSIEVNANGQIDLGSYGGALRMNCDNFKVDTNGALQLLGSGYVVNPTGMTLGQYSSLQGYIQVPGGTNGQFDVWGGGSGMITRFYSANSTVHFAANAVSVSGWGRTTHAGGHLIGGYNNIGASEGKSSPVYTIGSSYNPADTTLSNMYGIGFTGGSSTFLNSTNLGFTPSTGWGLYVASDGNARIFCEASSGHIFARGNVCSGGAIAVSGYGQVISNAGAWTGSGSVQGPQGIQGIQGRQGIQGIQGVSGTTYTTASNVQLNSLGLGTAASGTTGELRALHNITAYYSDMRLKKFLGKIEEALAKIRTVQGFYYTGNEKAKALGYISDESKPEVGVSAQEFKEIMPEIIREAPIDSQYMTLDYSKIVPLLIEAIKELDGKVAAQDKRIEELERWSN